MYMTKTRLFVALLTVLAVSFQSCKDEEGDTGNQPTKSIIQYLTDNGGYTEFLSAVETAGLTSKITGSGSFTLLAVSDLQLQDDGVDFSAMSNDEVISFVNYHFMESKMMPSSFTNRGYASTAASSNVSGKTLSVFTEVAGSSVTFNGQQANENYEATNGIVYVMAKSIAPASVIDHIGINPDLANYKSGVNLEGAIKTELGTGPNTVFAINDKQLVEWLNTKNAIRISDIAPSERRAIMNNTMIYDENKTSADLTGTVSTVGKDIAFTGSPEALTLNGSAQVIHRDIIATDGVMHIINGVLE